MNIGDEVLFHPYFKPARFDGPGYPATVTAVVGELVDLAVQLPDGGAAVELHEIPVGAHGTDEPGTCTPLAPPARVAEVPHAAAQESRVEPETPAEPASDLDEKQEVAAQDRTTAPVLEAAPRAVVGPALATLTCPMCMRKHRALDTWESRYCSDACEVRALTGNIGRHGPQKKKA